MKTVLIKVLTLFALLLLLVGCKEQVQEEAVVTSTVETEAVMSNLNKSLAVDLSHLELADGQPLVKDGVIKVAPERPQDPLSLPQLDKLHWYDYEFSGFNVEKVNQPVSPKDGAIGKRIVYIVNGNHPYMTAYGIGAKKIADAYDIEFIQLSSDWDLALQNEQVDQAITMKPDMIIINPLDVKEATHQLKKINEAGIPCIVSNMTPENEGMKYCLAWTGPDDWGQFRDLARVLAEAMDKKGGIAYLTHSVGGSVYFSRMMAPITELNTYAPEIKVLDYQSPGFDKEPSKEVVKAWIESFGDGLNAIVCADDSGQILGAIEALKEAGRQDVIVVAAGNSEDGMNAVKRGEALAITYQSAQSDGALAMKTATEWFNGVDLEPMSFLQKHIITADNVDAYMPAEWRYGE